MRYRLIPFVLLSVTPLLPQEPPKPEPAALQPPQVEQAKPNPESGAAAPEQGATRREELLKRFMERLKEPRNDSKRPLPFVFPGPVVPGGKPVRVIVKNGLDQFSPKRCSIPLLEVPAPDPNAKIVRLPVPESASKMPLLNVPAPPCETATP